MVRWVRGSLGLVIVLATFGAMMLIVKTQTAHAEGDNAFPGIINGTDWGFNNPNNNISPNPLLTWQFQPGQNNLTGNTEHILRNNNNGRNKGTRLRVYYTKRPTSITVDVNVGYCVLNADGDFAGNLVVTLGGQVVYNQATAGRKIDRKNRYFTWQNVGAGSTARPYTLVEISPTYDTSARPDPSSPVCNRFTAGTQNNYDIVRYNEHCNDPSADGTKCAGAGAGYYDKIWTHANAGTTQWDGSPLDSRYAVDNKLNAPHSALSVAFPQTGNGNSTMGYDANTGLWFADLDIDLTAANDNNNSGKEQQIDFKVTANDAFTASGVRMHALMGYRAFGLSPDAAKYFGLQGNGQDAGPWPNYGQKFAIPFGMSCGDTRASISPARIILYDPDTNTYGDSYAVVFKRDSAGTVTRLLKSEYNFIQNATWDTDRIKITTRENSVFEVKSVERGMSYMLAIANPNTSSNSPPSQNIWSLFLPTDSINGLINCNYNLQPHLNGVQPAFSAYGDTLTPHGWITNLEASTTTGDHEWRITRAVFGSRPADLSRTTVANTNNGEPICGFITRQSGPPVSCSVSYTGTYPTDSDKVVNDTVGSYPAGSYVCYITSIYNPTLAVGDDTQWANSPMQCSVAGVKPKVRVTGFDLKAGSGIDTSLSSQGGNTFGSWGEYGVFSNGTNTNMASGSGLLGGGPNSQFFWSALTFANNGLYGRYGGVLPPSYSPGTGTAISNVLGATTYGEGDKRVLQYNGTLYITGNLTYDNDGNDNNGYNSIKDIPEIKIVADNIIIAPNVTQIDPWLVVRSSAGVYGKLSTCGTSPGVPTPGVAGFQPFNASGLLTTGLCQNELKLNGPVITDQVYAYRTKDAPGDAWAENFDLRASNFLSSYAGINTSRPVARTELITELPPRF